MIAAIDFSKYGVCKSFFGVDANTLGESKTLEIGNFNKVFFQVIPISGDHENSQFEIYKLVGSEYVGTGEVITGDGIMPSITITEKSIMVKRILVEGEASIVDIIIAAGK